MVSQIPIVPPEAYTIDDFSIIIPRVLELVCTAWDVQPLIDEVWQQASSGLRMSIMRQWENNRIASGGNSDNAPVWYTRPQDGFSRPPFKWNEPRRARISAELDALYAKLYGLDEGDLRYILDPSEIYGAEFPGETFRVLEEKETARYGEYRTKRLVLEAEARLEKGELE